MTTYTLEEQNIINKYYPTEGAIKCAEMLKRSADTIRHYASNHNIQHINNAHVFTEDENNFLIENYSILGTAVCAQLLDIDIAEPF